MIGFNTMMQESIKRNKGKVHPIDKVGYKLKGYLLAERNGIRHAEIFKIYNRIEEVNWDELPGEFVIKPQQGCSESGVFPLIRKGEGYRNILKNKDMAKREIIKSFQEGITGSHSHSRELWIEELLSNPLPYDWKIHTFNGKIGMIEQFKRNEENKYHKYWTEEWQPIENMCKKIFTYKINNSLPPPEHPEGLLKTARVLSKAIGHPYIRMDLYDTPKGVFLGEITPHPGRTCVYADYWENHLGEMWRRAEEELKNG